MKLNTWAKQVGIGYQTAYRLFRAGKLPVRAEQLTTGTILVYPEAARTENVVLYARVSSHDQKEDLARQVSRLEDYCSAKGWQISKTVAEIGSGLNGRRRKLLHVLSDSSATCLVVEHRDRLARFGVEYVEACLASSGRKLVVINETEHKDDLVQDFVDVVTAMCARIYGRRSSANRAKRALEAAARENN